MDQLFVSDDCHKLHEPRTWPLKLCVSNDTVHFGRSTDINKPVTSCTRTVEHKASDVCVCVCAACTGAKGSTLTYVVGVTTGICSMATDMCNGCVCVCVVSVEERGSNVGSTLAMLMCLHC